MFLLIERNYLTLRQKIIIDKGVMNLNINYLIKALMMC